MDVITALKTSDIRIDNRDKWLVWDEPNWCVYQRKYHARTTNLLFMGWELDHAIDVLIKEE